MKRENLDLSVSRYNIHTGKLINLYKHISTFEEAHLLSLLEMNNKDDEGLVVILPGWNLKVDDDIMEKQSKLAEKYKVERL